MKHCLLTCLLIAMSFSITACYGPTPPPPRGQRGRSLDVPPRYGVTEEQTRYFEGTNSTLGGPNAAVVQPPNLNAPVTPPPTTDTPSAPPPVVVTPPPPAPAPAADIPFATRIPGKPGFVKSPFDPGGQAIDVRDFQSGQKARCPYTGKIFRVP